MRQIPSLVDKRILSPAQAALALDLVSPMDLLRLKAIARVYARGLPPEVTWEDLLQEALTRIIVGSRRRPEGITTVAFVAGILRSLRAERWRRAARESAGNDALRIDHERDDSLALALTDPAPGPERTLSARQELIAIRELFADDPTASRIISGLAEGLSAEQIRRSTGLTKTDYDSARRRIRRTLLREGLTCERK
jgi:DNA-directed RNA polymerase specialized sigma24 family protein